MVQRTSLGSDNLNKAKVVAILVFLLLLSFLVFLTANATQDVRNVANFYESLSIVGLIALLVDFGIKKTGFKVRRGGKDIDFPDTIIYEKSSPYFRELPHTIKVLIVVITFFIGGWLIVNITNAPAAQIVDAPTFQLLDVGVQGNAFLSGIAGIAENWFFFGFLMPTLFAVLFIITRSFWAATAAIIIVMPFIFVGYHFAVYGESTVALQAVYFMGLLWTGTTLALGNLLFADVTHFSNNFAITFARAGATSPGIFLLLYAGVGTLISFFAWRSKPSKDEKY